MINKEEFVKALNDVEKCFKYQEGLNDYFRDNDADGYIFQPDCSDTVIRLLHLITGVRDIDEWIEYFCYELDFGKKWKEGMITYPDGTDIIMNSPESLYDFLMNE